MNMDSHPPKKLGEGAYGAVFLKNGYAVKQFDRLAHVIQEYLALKYLSDCNYIVNVKTVDFPNLQIGMELYDCNLKSWLISNRNSKKYEIYTDQIINNVLHGLIELHDRGLCHGDLKPGNILIRKNPLKAVLGDCGFVSISKYAKTNMTTETYRDPHYEKTSAHDMFSFGICLFEIITKKRIYAKDRYQEYYENGKKKHKLLKYNYNEFRSVVKKEMSDNIYRRVILDLLNKNKLDRPTSRDVLIALYKENPICWKRPEIKTYDMKIPDTEVKMIRDIIQVIGHKYKINRCNQGYSAIIHYLNQKNIETQYYSIYTFINLMILSSVFGRSGLNSDICLSLCGKNITNEIFNRVINDLLMDKDYISTILYLNYII